MGQKVNAVGFRLGYTLDWKLFFQCYNTLTDFYSKLIFSKQQILNHFTSCLLKPDYLFYRRVWKFIHSEHDFAQITIKRYVSIVICDHKFFLNSNKELFISIYYSECAAWDYLRYKKKKYSLSYFDHWNKLMGSKSFQYTIEFYNSLLFWALGYFVTFELWRVSWLSKPQTIAYWIKLNLEKTTKSVKFILKRLRSKFKKIQDKKIIKLTQNGYVSYKIKSLKIHCQGRLKRKWIRSMRSKHLNKAIAHERYKMPLQSLKASIEYAQCIAYNKAGTYGIKVWLNYEQQV
uniref:ribosomal protein S3 n=1 Tax=Glaucosphaera vacuolata TaxID=38265 RepID=UPI001FCD9E25|nr:ribosomal protein S3 [Glaucosphaera vacuolata]UNJ18760.1 ribosomal protein S3 [Glaucosphaera vacuolata]